MKIIVGISRIFVGVLFIISGFIKLNDPVGFSYKLQEYFGENVLDLEFLIPFALGLAILLVIFEVMVGIMLLIGYLPKFTIWSLLGMITFFTFLTFYSAYYNKVTDCGCFGDALPLTPWQSFLKDLVLFILIIVLYLGRSYITPLVPQHTHKWIVFAGFLGCMSFAYYVLMHLPAIDFRPYKIGANITEGMQVPDGAVEPQFAYHWKFKDGGEEKIITTEGAYPETTGEFIAVETEMIDEGYTPPIHDFSIEKDGEDFTKNYLEKPKVILVVLYNLAKSEKEGLSKLNELQKEAKVNNYDIIALSASGPADIRRIKEVYQLNFDFYFTDETALKTMIRSNPGVFRLHKGTILQKLHWNDIEDLEW